MLFGASSSGEKRRKKIKKSTNSNFGFHIGYFGMPAEANFGGALAVT